MGCKELDAIVLLICCFDGAAFVSAPDALLFGSLVVTDF